MSHLMLMVLDEFGFEAEVELVCGPRAVAFYYDGSYLDVLLREQLREWLTYPQNSISGDQVSLTFGAAGVALCIDPFVPSWRLTPVVLARLRERI